MKALARRRDINRLAKLTTIEPAHIFCTAGKIEGETAQKVCGALREMMGG